MDISGQNGHFPVKMTFYCTGTRPSPGTVIILVLRKPVPHMRTQDIFGGVFASSCLHIPSPILSPYPLDQRMVISAVTYVFLYIDLTRIYLRFNGYSRRQKLRRLWVQIPSYTIWILDISLLQSPMSRGCVWFLALMFLALCFQIRVP